MTITKYTYDNLAGTGFQWHPVTDEGDVLFYPCGDLKGVKAFVEACGDLIEDQLADKENNYGLHFTPVVMMEKPNKSSFQVGQKKGCQYFRHPKRGKR